MPRRKTKDERRQLIKARGATNEVWHDRAKQLARSAKTRDEREVKYSSLCNLSHLFVNILFNIILTFARSAIIIFRLSSVARLRAFFRLNQSLNFTSKGCSMPQKATALPSFSAGTNVMLAMASLPACASPEPAGDSSITLIS